MPAQGLGRCDDDVQAVGLTIRPIAMPAQGLGRCDPWAFTLATQSYPVSLRCGNRHYRQSWR